MFEGDIEVTPEQMDRLKKGANKFGSIIGGRWPGGRIPYRIESSIGKTLVTLITFFTHYFLLEYRNFDPIITRCK